MKAKETNTGNWFVDQLNLYQSANSDNQSVKDNFLVRRAEFELIINDLKNKKNKDPLQHELLLGRRGSGKSTLLKRLQIEIEENHELSKKYIPINLAEEQAGIYRLFDLWKEVLKELSVKCKITLSLRDYFSFENNQEYTRYLYSEIHKSLKDKQKRVILFLDNLDRIVESFTDDGNLLRETLLNYNDIQIIGGSTRMDEHFWRYDQPFYEFFRRHRLEALTSEEIHLLLRHWSKLMDLPELATFSETNPGKIEAIRIITDGLPRTLQFFIQILLQNSSLYGFDYIRKVMDSVTPLYQERLNHLPAPQRKIVLEMAFLWEACSAKQLAEKCSMESKLVSAQLKQLTNNGIVETLSTSKKNHLYRLSERFFNMWLIITQGNPDQKRKAKWLTIFLETWYNEAQLKKMVQKHIQNLEQQNINGEKAILLTKALSQSKYATTFQRDQMLNSVTCLKAMNVDQYLIELPKKYEDLGNEIETLIEGRKYDDAHAIADEIENEDDGMKFFIKALLYDEEAKSKKAEKYYLLAAEKEHTASIFNLAILYTEIGKTKEAEKYYLLAIEKGNIDALNNLAILYKKIRKTKDAEKHFLLAIEKGDIKALNNIAIFYEESGKIKEAENYYHLAIEKGYTDALFNLALLHEDNDKFKKAEKYYRMAIQKGNTNALYNLSLLNYHQGIHKKEALDLIRKHNTKISDIRTLSLQIIIEIWNGDFEQVEEKVKRAITDARNSKAETLIRYLLIHQQVYMVVNLFNDSTIGKGLQERFSLIYYATLLLNKDSDENLELRIPPEVMPTVQEIIEEIKQKQVFYSKS